MKIAIDARMYGLEHAGIGRYVMNLISELARIDKVNNYIVFLRNNYYKKLHFPGNWKKVLADFRHYSLAEQFKLPGLINKEKPNLVHFPHLNVPVFYSGKFVVTIHDLTMHKQGKDATNMPLPIYFAKRLPYKFVVSNAVNRAARILVPSNSVKSEVVDYYSCNIDKIIVTYEGIDKCYLTKINSDIAIFPYKLEGKYFVYTGNAYPHKNLERLVESVVHLNKHLGLQITLAVVGSRNVFLDRIKKYVEDREANEYVKLLGYVPDDYLRLVYKNSIALVFPSMSEGFGLPGLEAMAAGTLVLASNILVFKEIYGDNAFYFDPYDFKSISHAMKNAVKMSGEERKKIIQANLRFVKKYSWSKMAKETIRVYENCVDL